MNAEKEFYIDCALDSLDQLFDAYRHAKEQHDSEWREFWNESVIFWARSVSEWSQLASEV